MHRRPGLGAALLLAALLAGLPAALAAQPTAPAWEVDREVRLEGLTLPLASDVVVRAGGSLALLGVHVLAAGSPLRPVEVRVEAGGALELRDGREAVTGAMRPTRLDSPLGGARIRVDPGGALLAEGAELEGWVLESAGDARLAGSVLHLAGPVVIGDGRMVVLGGAVQGSPGDLFALRGGVLAIENATLDGAGQAAVRASGGTRLELRGGSVNGTGTYGLVLAGAAATVEDVAFTDLGEYALRADGGTTTLRHNRFASHCGAFLAAGAQALVEGNRFTVTGNGLTLHDAGAVAVRGNSFVGGATGLSASRSSPVVEANRFASASVGMSLVASDASLRGNTFAANERGIEVQSLVRASVPEIRDNLFEGNGAGLTNLQPDAVDARWNWWGAAGGPGAAGADAVEGAVDVAPWLGAPP